MMAISTHWMRSSTARRTATSPSKYIEMRKAPSTGAFFCLGNIINQSTNLWNDPHNRLAMQRFFFTFRRDRPGLAERDDKDPVCVDVHVQ